MGRRLQFPPKMRFGGEIAVVSRDEVKFESLGEAAPDAMLGVDSLGVILFVNRQTELLFGYDRDTLVGQPLDTLVPDSLLMVRLAPGSGFVADPAARATGAGLELTGRRRDGTEVPTDISLSSIETGDGWLTTATVRDVTERTKGDRELQRMAAIIEYSDDAIISKTVDGIITTWNPAAERMYGYSSEEIIGESIALIAPSDRSDEMTAIMARIKAGQTTENLETVRLRKDGTVFPVALTVSPIRSAEGAIVGAATIARDVTDRKEADRELQRMAAIIEYSDDAIISETVDGIITTWNPAAERMYGYSSEEIIGGSIALIAPQELFEEVIALMARIKAGQTTEHFETFRLRKDATAFPVALTVSPIHDGGGAIVGASTIARDVAKQMQAFDAARGMIESSLDSLVPISPDWMSTDLNEATIRVTGVPRDRLIGTAFSDYFTDPAKAEEIYQRVFTDGMAADYPLTLRHRDGHE